MTKREPNPLPLFCQEKSDHGLWIPEEILKNPTLTPVGKMLLSRITGFEANGCYMTNETIAGLFGVSIPTVKREISELSKVGLIKSEWVRKKRVGSAGNGMMRVLKRVNLSPLKAEPDQIEPVETVNGINLNRIKLSSEGDHFDPQSKEESKDLSKGKGKRFVPPTLEEVKAYLAERPEYARFEPARFIDYYTELNWHDRDGTPVRNWKARIISTWGKDNGKSRNASPKTHRNDFDKIESAFGRTIKV